MKTVCVITGGGSGMGLAAAKCMPKEKIIVVTGRTMSKLEKAVKELDDWATCLVISSGGEKTIESRFSFNKIANVGRLPIRPCYIF